MEVVVCWKSVTSPPFQCGWYLGMLLPYNYENSSIDKIQSWQNKFGFTIVWFNPEAIDHWWRVQTHARGVEPIGHLITHWADPVIPPPINDPPIPSRQKPL